MPIEEIRRAVHGRWRTASRPLTVEGVSTDTRTARPGDLFIALVGERFDGHDFLADAARAGCVSAVLNHSAPIEPSVAETFGGGVIGVEDTTTALGELASHYRSQFPATVIAVTGSNGKTTVKRMIDHILSRRLEGTSSPKSFNNAVGVPLTLLQAGTGDDYVVCELGTNAPGEIAALSRIARPDIAVITSVAETHLEKLGSLERVAVEKAAILGGMQARGIAIVNADSPPLARAMRAYDTARLIHFGTSDEAELRLTGYEATADGGRFELNGRAWFDLPLPGRHNALNALAAIGVAQRMGLDQDAAADALGGFAGVEMRLERMTIGELTVINDAYNANPASVLAAVDALTATGAKRRVAILGDMREMGPQAEPLHVSTGREIASRGVDLLIGVGELGRYFATGAAEQGVPTESYDSPGEASAAVAGLLRAGDAVLIKGSRAMEMERLIDPIRRAFEPAPADAAPRSDRGGKKRIAGRAKAGKKDSQR